MADNNYERGLTYSATFQRWHLKDNRLLLIFETPDGAERIFTKNLDEEKGFVGAANAVKALGQTDSMLPITAKPGTSVKVVLSAKNPAFINFVNADRKFKPQELDDELCAQYNEMYGEVPF